MISSDTGFSRDYSAYPYVRGGLDYRTNDADTFSVTNPPPDAQFQNKEMVSGVFVGDAVKGYVWTRLQDRAGADQGVVIDEVGGTPIALVFHLPSRYVQAFEARAGGELSEARARAAAGFAGLAAAACVGRSLDDARGHGLVENGLDLSQVRSIVRGLGAGRAHLW
ncbi:MAG: DUF3179 domain-containing protein [Deltaproteobacteria bacterium]|nr:DUF3179 domain-containing protein [Deltaproteobacteria bacterium]